MTGRTGRKNGRAVPAGRVARRAAAAAAALCAALAGAAPAAENPADTAPAPYGKGGGAVVRRIPEPAPNPRASAYLKREKIRLQNLTTDVCRDFREGDVEFIFCANPVLMLLEEQYLNSRGLTFDKDGCVFGCSEHRRALAKCAKGKFALICAQNYFESLMAGDAIAAGREGRLDLEFSCRSADGEGDGEGDGAAFPVTVSLWSTVLPAASFAVDGVSYRVYGYPQFRGEYFRDMSSICLGCDFRAQLALPEEGRAEIVLGDGDRDRVISCAAAPAKAAPGKAGRPGRGPKK